jgi:nitric oxide reductase activation protein
VDRAAAEYLGRIFGAAGHSILRQPEHLPIALVQVVRQLLAS